jgi:di/tricarboxylate transporter
LSTQLIICLVIFGLTCIGYLTGAGSLAAVAMASVAALSLTGCLTAEETLAYFSNGTVIMIGAMSVVAAGFGRTRFCAGLAGGISRAAKGRPAMVLLLYCILTMLLSQMVQSPVVVFGIAAPLCMASADAMGIPRSRFALALGVVSIATCSTLPIGTGATQAAELNSYISAYYDKIANFSGTLPEMGFFDPMKARLPMLVFTVIYCALAMPRFTPDRTAGEAGDEVAKGATKPPLAAFPEIAGIVIFFGTAAALMLQAGALRFLAAWQICLAGAVLMVFCGVLKPKEAGEAIPVSMLLLIVGALAMAGALSGTGAGSLIGGWIAGLVESAHNNYLVGFIFFFFPFLLAQFMSNRGAMLLFFPIAIAACHQVGGDPRGLLILIEAGALTAFMTPMPTAAVPYMMAYGGYRQQDLVKGGWLYAVISCILSVGWVMTVMPVLP